MIVGVKRSFPGPWKCVFTRRGVLIRDCRGVVLAHVEAFGPAMRAKSKGQLLSPIEAKAVAYAISQTPVLWYWLRMYRSRKPHKRKQRKQHFA